MSALQQPGWVKGIGRAVGTETAKQSEMVIESPRGMWSVVVGIVPVDPVMDLEPAGSHPDALRREL